MPLTSKPRFPVVDNNPDWGRTILNYGPGDLATIGSFTGAGYLTGFFGSRMKLRNPNARFLMGIGFCAGFFYAYQSSTQRLMGLQENAAEVGKFGVMSKSELQTAIDRSHAPNIELIKTEKPRD